MLYYKKSTLFAMIVTAKLAQGTGCADIWSASRCSSQEKKGNCAVCRVVELDASTSRLIAD